ncbi:MAG TPA: YtcA family lipoprotein [Sphingomonas sp.]
MRLRVLLIGAACGLGGCAARGAPSFALFGAYFPGWLFCALIGVAGAIATRIGIGAAGLSDAVPAQLLVCTAVAVIAAGLCWLLWLGR